ncbi:MAG: PilZ domain-containing protein [Nitrospiraceae bacterium]
MPVRRCPKCGTSKTTLAPRRTVSDRLLGALTIYPCRCQLCSHRFRTFFGRPSTNPRRNFERVPVQYPVWFQLSCSAAQSLGQSGTIINLSIRGCRIKSSATVPKGTVLRLEFQSSTHAFPITIDGAMVRSRTNDSIGLRFVSLLREEERRIRRIVDLRLPTPPR